MASSYTGAISCLVDTDIVIDFLRRRDYARDVLEYWAGKGLLAISTITHLEIYQGMKAGEEKATNAFLDGLVSVAVDTSIARRAGTMLGELRSKGMTVGIADAIIAATALEVDTHGQSPWHLSKNKLCLTPYGRVPIHPRAKPVELCPSG